MDVPRESKDKIGIKTIKIWLEISNIKLFPTFIRIS
jgi:hypothetical protein